MRVVSGRIGNEKVHSSSTFSKSHATVDARARLLPATRSGLRSTIDAFIVPSQKVDARRVTRRGGNGHRGPVERIVRSAVSIVLLEPRTDLEPVLRCNRDVALIEEPVQVGPKQNAIADIVGTMLRVRLDVRSLQSGQRMLLCDRTRPRVRIHHGDTEDSLAKPWLNQLWRAVAKRILANEEWLSDGRHHIGCPRSRETFFPDASALSDGQVVPLVPQVLRGPIAGARNPFIRPEERRLREQNATDLVRGRWRSIVDPRSNPAGPLAHGLKPRATILRLERFPSEPVRQARVSGKVRKSADGVAGAP